MYIIERSQHLNGIYGIFNIVEKRVYIGLASSLQSRSQQHLGISKSNNSKKNGDNLNLEKETNKLFWQFVVAFNPDKGEYSSVEARLYEHLFMYLIASKVQNNNPIHTKENKQGVLYNDQLNKPLKEMYKHLKRRVRDYNAKYNQNINLDDKLICAENALNEDLQNRFKMTLSEWDNMDRNERESHWNDAVRKLENEKVNGIDYIKIGDKQKIMRVIGNKVAEEEVDFSTQFACANLLLSMPKLSKGTARQIGIDWDEIELFNNHSNNKDPLNLNKLAVITKFGSHNNESPYEILLKMKIDLDNTTKSSNGENRHCIWALRRFGGDWVRRIATEELKANANNRVPIYLLMMFTGSDITSNKKVDLNAAFTKQEIMQKDKDIKKNNPNDLMNYYRVSNQDNWAPLSEQLTYITCPNDSNERIDGLVIKNFWFTKESFNRCDLPQFFNSKLKSYANTPWEEKEASKSLSGSTSTVCVRLKQGLTPSNFNSIPHAEHDQFDCLIAELQYPYVVELAHDK